MLNPKEAPEGYRAKKAQMIKGRPQCTGCCFLVNGMCEAPDGTQCSSLQRKDFTDVIYAKLA